MTSNVIPLRKSPRLTPTYASAAKALIDAGYAPVPIELGSKRPTVLGWQKRIITDEVVDEWCATGKSNCGIGIRGDHTPGVDLDISDTDVLERVLAWAGEHIGVVNRRVGRPPRVLFTCHADEPFAYMCSGEFQSPDGITHQIEILSRAHQFVAYAIHPGTNKPYSWEGADPLSVPAELLPTLTPDKARDLIEYFESIVPETWTRKSKSSAPRGAERLGNPKKTADVHRVRSAMDAIPNNDLPYDDWIRVMYALWNAVGEESRWEGYDIFDKWSAKSEKYDPIETDRVWQATHDVEHIGFGTLAYIAQQNGWIDPGEDTSDDLGVVEDIGGGASAESSSFKDANGNSSVANLQQLKPYVWRECTSIRPRRWLYDQHLIAQYVSLTISPGGLGKSSLKQVDAVAMATGRALLGARPVRPLRVMYWNGEDPADEVERRFAAVFKHYEIGPSDIADRLFIETGETFPIKLAQAGKNGVTVAEKDIERLIARVSEARLDVLIADPFVTTHSVPENDNTAVNEVASMWRKIARRTGCAVELVHHAVKQARLPGQSEALGDAQSRGGGSLLDAVRSTRFLVGMSTEEGKKLGISKPGSYFRVEGGKANMTPRIEEATWRRLVSVPLDNGDNEYPDGDFVAVVTPWNLPNPAEGLGDDVLLRVKARVAGGQWRENHQASDWVGYAIAEAVGLDIGPAKRADRTDSQQRHRIKVTALLSQWMAAGGLVRVMRRDPKNRRETPFIECGQG